MDILKIILEFNPIDIFLFSLFFFIFFLILYLIKNLNIISGLKEKINYLEQTIQKLDYQSKIILKSDIELKLYQEEIEDKLNKITFLKNFIISSSHLLDKEQLFLQINESNLADFGFKKGLILNFDDWSVKTNIGFISEEIEKVILFLQHKKEIFKTAILITKDLSLNEEIAKLLKTKNILINPIRGKEKIYAVFILADYFLSGEIDRTGKEIFSIICTHLGQCLDNIQLYEDLYNIKEEFELKIKERTNELVKSLRQIESVSKAKSDFVSGVSHELRTPLTSIKGFASLLAEEKFGKLPPEAKERLKKIDENINKLVDMVNTLLDISHIESGKIEIRIVPSDIVKLIKDVTDFLSPQIKSKNISLTIETPTYLDVYMDKNLIERVLINLLNNAIKFTPKEGEIKIFCKKETNKAIISIKDNGCGISKENIDKVFKEFFRDDNPVNREVRGSGLGLSLVKRIIDIHKEKIWFESEQNKGTVFYFTLQIVK
ncbi:MAG: HAMP domain-containing histidine kinase [Candidatus Omnitrophica bacterium]|nr:HAMP domain-containing histidine kinase [Candidatus Omnitrophota bacterium]